VGPATTPVTEPYPKRIPGDNRILNLKGVSGPGRRTGTEIHHNGKSAEGHANEGSHRRTQRLRKGRRASPEQAPASRIQIVDFPIEKVATLSSEVLTIEGVDIRLLEELPHVIQLFGGEGLEKLAVREVAKVYTGLAYQGPGGAIKNHHVIGSGQTSGNVNPDFHLPATRYRREILNATLEAESRQAEEEGLGQLLHGSPSLDAWAREPLRKWGEVP